MEPFVNSTSDRMCDVADVLDDTRLLKWAISRLRTFLYLSNPMDEAFQFVHQVADYHTETFPFLICFVFLEWYILWVKGKPLPLLGDTTASTSMIVNMECARIFCRGIEHWIYIQIYNNYRIVDLPWDHPVTWYLSAIFVDFCYYWGHRFSHIINVLWAQHQAHHSAETYSLVNVFRLPFTQDWLYFVFYLPMALFVPPSLYLVHHQLNLVYQFWLHTEVIGKLGPIEYVFNTPSHHRVHHGSNKYCLDRNFGGWLIIWDRMFGTFQEELSDVPIVYGLVDPVKSFNPIYLQVFYLEKMFRKWQLMDGWKNKISSIIKGPGWSPGSPWTGYIDQVPDVTWREKHNYPPKPFVWSVYMFTHFIIILIIYESIGFFRNSMSALSITCHLVFVVLSLANVGMFYDGNPAAFTVEFLRCALAAVYTRGAGGVTPLLGHVLRWFGLSRFQYVISAALSAYFFASAGVWGLLSACQVYQHAALHASKFKNL